MEPMKRNFARRLASAGAALAIVAGTFAGLGATLAATALPAAAATSPCIETVSTLPGTVVSAGGGTIIVGVTAGTTVIKIDCNQSATPFGAAPASLLAAVATSGVSATSLADSGALALFTASTTDTGCPAATAGSCTVANFTVPATFTASNTAAQCPQTQAQTNAGLWGCAVAVVNSTLAPVAGGEFLITYSGAPTPAAPTIAAAATTGVAGNTVAISDASGNTSYWWTAAMAQVTDLALGLPAPTAPSSCTGTGGGFGNAPTALFQANWIPSSGTNIVQAAPSGVTLSFDCFDGTTLYNPVLGGTLTVPATATPGATYTVYLCEANATPIAGNDANATTDCGSAPPTPALGWIDASFTYTIEAAAGGSATPSSGGVGTSVSVTASGLDAQGTSVYVGFTTGSNTAANLGTTGPSITGSTGTCNPVTSAGDVTCSISVTSVDRVGSNPIVLYQADAGPTTTLDITFNVTAISTTCTVTAPATSCAIQQTITLTVNPGTLSISETSPKVTLTPVTLNGTAQSATGNLNQVVVNDSRGTLVGWSLVGQFQGNFQNGTPSGPAADNTIPVAGANGFNWTPTVTPSTSVSTEVAAGGATTAGLSTTAPTSLCTGGVAANGGGGGGITDCNAGVTLGVPASVAAGTYSATLNLTIS